MTNKIHRPIFADRIKVQTPYTPGGNLASTFKKFGWVPPTEAVQAQQQAEQQVPGIIARAQS